ncbi:hypothetical protein ACVCAH_36875 [Micromonospora sp. LZ34]
MIGDHPDANMPTARIPVTETIPAGTVLDGELIVLERGRTNSVVDEIGWISRTDGSYETTGDKTRIWEN